MSVTGSFETLQKFAVSACPHDASYFKFQKLLISYLGILIFQRTLHSHHSDPLVHTGWSCPTDSS